MSTEAQKLMVIHDASRNDGLSAIIWAFKSLPIRSGDELTLLGVIHPPSSALRIKSKVDVSGSNPKNMDHEWQEKEYLKKEEVIELSKICEENKGAGQGEAIEKLKHEHYLHANQTIRFKIDLQAGSSPKMIAAYAAKNLSLTWVILDRQMKKDRRYFMEKLTCGILRMRSNNTIEKLRGPIKMEDKKLPFGKRSTSSDHFFSYGEMIPEISNKGLSRKKTPSAQKPTNLLKPEGGNSAGAASRDQTQVSWSPPSTHQILSSASASSSSSMGNSEVSSSTDAKRFPTKHFQQDNVPTNSQLQKAGEQPPNSIPHSEDGIEVKTFSSGSTYDEKERQQHLSTSYTFTEGHQEEEEFEYSVCLVCENRRPSICWKKDFHYAELCQATDGFSSKNFLSEGGFGSVYKGELKCGLKVAVKQHKDMSLQGEKEFKSEVNVLSKARHKNLVVLLGSCSEGTHRLLVYEFVCNGSLDQHLSRHAEKPLTWDKRIKIALGAARGLDYLHRTNIIHRDMRPNNILITHDYESLLGDFGLARTQCGDTDETRVVGTLGYVAPEYAECGKVSKKTDVYSFGVVLLQLITGCKTTEEKFAGKSLVEWARPLLEEKNYPDLIDERIVDSHDVHQLLLMVRLAECCLNKDPSERHTMESVSFDKPISINDYLKMNIFG